MNKTFTALTVSSLLMISFLSFAAPKKKPVKKNKATQSRRYEAKTKPRPSVTRSQTRTRAQKTLKTSRPQGQEAE